MPSTALTSTSTPLAIHVRRVDFANARDARALVDLLDGYARDAAGGGKPLSDEVKQGLPAALRQRPQAFSVIAWAADAAAPHGEVPVGLINCLEGFSTFACKPLVNVHDVAVAPGWRGHRIAQRMLQAVEVIARERGACKLTMEVLSGNHSALRAYEREGFAAYTLDPGMGQAQFLQKVLHGPGPAAAPAL
ncbi:GNAT family N-acetyltransferase [Acidovorax sp. LjRoot117]|uniref:GNAT family N-acetyltransferase n=1 Tax=Acidovorax sp. LjRoot117 TaxID=3342255 RepID=UPI003ED0EFD2